MCVFRYARYYNDLTAKLYRLFCQAKSEILEDHPFEKLSIAAVAGEAGLSTRSLQKFFQAAYRFMPKQYHLQIQMNAAMTLLVDDRLPGSAVAERLGYADLFAFSKQLKKFFVIRPLKSAAADKSPAQNAVRRFTGCFFLFVRATSCQSVKLVRRTDKSV